MRAGRSELLGLRVRFGLPVALGTLSSLALTGVGTRRPVVASNHSFWTRIGLPAAIVTIVSLALGGGGMFWAADRSDAMSVARQTHVATRALDAALVSMARAQVLNAVWDEAVPKLAGPTDSYWFYNNYANYFNTLYGRGDVYILDAHDRPLYASQGGRIIDPAAFERVRPSLAATIAVLRGEGPTVVGAEAPQHIPGVASDGRGIPVVYSARLARVFGRPAAISVMRIVPASNAVPLARGAEPLFVLVRFLDAVFSRTLEDQQLMADAHVTSDDRLAAGEASLPLKTPDGLTVGHLAWRPYRAGTRLIARLAPLAALSAASAIALMLWLVWTARRMFVEVEAARATAMHRSLHDRLTGLPNRELFADRLHQSVARARQGSRSALLMLDLDRFKAVNDTFGHTTGDAVLCNFAERARATLRHTDIIARLGGDEFAIILADSGSAHDVTEVCVALIETSREPFHFGEGSASIGVSIGVALMTRGEVDVDALIARADRALYAAKNAGRNCFRFAEGAPKLVAVAVQCERGRAKRNNGLV